MTTHDTPPTPTSADQAQAAFNALWTGYWNGDDGLFAIRRPLAPAGYDLAFDLFHYWWQAHALDALVDAFERDGRREHLEHAAHVLSAIVRVNGGLTNDYYDDMEWLALACLRAWDAGAGDAFREAALTLWADIQNGWNAAWGGGVAWRKSQLDYKNTPANAPAAILAARLYQRFGRPDDLAWAERISAWLDIHLVDPASGFVWDGINRLGDGAIDREWTFTYCQGVTVGAALELFTATGDDRHLARARRTALAAVQRWPQTLPDEGVGDAGLFKGILVRYLGALERVSPDADRRAWLRAQAHAAWRCRDPVTGLNGTSWTRRPGDAPLDLSTALSGVFVYETVAALDRADAARPPHGQTT
ncbi:putative alpha-1,6-mannanase (GH76 family) [Deinococcus metalli]|uniref:Glycoside hydrolase n=1 Tax=Deinococcus metalli TaxID=1141878 RepID=A0A7W8KEP1_9DEIO|nr:glycoside hydrolase family 76 protein [Deinococcus metalli]MBB5376530.1 putative alpha-1,6-mannanase (GH76 family) [Deinococcus metalli]GHF43334.1 glycoside hydrolase [Deinococcus metalli]